jgi:hypothetical protein
MTIVNDTFAIGTILDIDKNDTVPTGWEVIEYDTGWTNLPLNTSKCSVAPSTGVHINTDFTPQLRRIGNTVCIRGKLLVNKSSIQAGTMNQLSTIIDAKFVPSEQETQLSFYDYNGSHATIFITSQSRERADSKGSRLGFYPNSGWTNLPSQFEVKLTATWDVDDLTTKRIKKIS